MPIKVNINGMQIEGDPADIRALLGISGPGNGLAAGDVGPWGGRQAKGAATGRPARSGAASFNTPGVVVGRKPPVSPARRKAMAEHAQWMSVLVQLKSQKDKAEMKRLRKDKGIGPSMAFGKSKLK